MEEEIASKDETKIQINSIRSMLEESDKFMFNNISSSDMAAVVSINNEQLNYVTNLRDNISVALEKLYSLDEPFICEEDMFAVASELDTVIITSNFSDLIILSRY